ncbi:nitrate transport protein; NrtC [Synechocystis sp. PCC 6803]|jgi:nitrate/nitrite transport system ATP-binding protein|uniref:Nitrate import ATP-binding protein NrtC n=1 Tax=Synechocystis sp. (strain ATCC 27184 / PCC 6803 / Kazusa) TaxID=1111708 RepID=NRTC_SYNY3|nr:MULTISPECIES: nitrate ABC transporter ATP-binding protein [unclassified Synechocystis]P73450.1 RecName: Full=Nitrate import ATP-binding protein NrtC [Synechocystis sp. PCC 6803 substr. Kazusa]BAM51222.1 nitrate transport protein NrtC [Synechocystis sp. PCC 6803] [Bacillus subtilis BEST7613]AGF51179.1 nitrate transport protein NrtC [Synechocystis sp. PCC 6803]ALJ67203.1 bacitracin ABC transporter ATP-binding protein [Synechocystis sp. PCC 6803]AVP89045.1 nitrate transport ATP-binding protein
MMPFIEIDHVDRIFPLPDGGRYIALKNIELKISQGEFISLIGHSGCGKSTLLNMISGLDKPTFGGVIMEGKEITEPGPERMVVFQNYSLLPWLTVRQNIALAVNRVLRDLPKPEQEKIIDDNIALVGLQRAAHKRPGELSGGMKQRVAIARALSTRPKVLLLDEPFGALDALTRGNLQERLMEIVQESGVTCIMVTHDVDEALLLSDRVVMLTTGPEAHIGQILEVPIPRPRHRLEVVNHPSYYALRGEMVYFLNQQKRAKKVGAVSQFAEAMGGNGLEKINLDLGFIPLTDCAPLVVAKEKGFFQKHGLEQVNLVKEPSWQAIADGIRERRLDGAQMVAGMPLALTLGMGGKTPLPMVTAMVMSRNGNAITLSKKFAEAGVKTLEDLRLKLAETPDQVSTLGMVHPASMQNLLLRYWLASGSIDPDQDINLMRLPPPQMVSNLEAGNIDGFCVGEPWNSYAVKQNLGYVIATDLDIWNGHPEKVLGMREEWVNKYPATHLALVKALLEACEYCDDRRHRQEILDYLALPQYVGTSTEYISPGFLTEYDQGNDAEAEMLLDFNQFYVKQSNYPSRSEGLWILTQLARWGYIDFPKNWVEIIERVRRPDLFGEACRHLGWPDLEGDHHNVSLFDGMVFTPNDPLGYIKRFTIHRDIQVTEILIDQIDQVNQ